MTKTTIRQRRRLVAREAPSSSRCAMYHRILNGMFDASACGGRSVDSMQGTCQSSQRIHLYLGRPLTHQTHVTSCSARLFSIGVTGKGTSTK